MVVQLANGWIKIVQNCIMICHDLPVVSLLVDDGKPLAACTPLSHSLATLFLLLPQLDSTIFELVQEPPFWPVPHGFQPSFPSFLPNSNAVCDQTSGANFWSPSLSGVTPDPFPPGPLKILSLSHPKSPSQGLLRCSAHSSPPLPSLPPTGG